MSKYSNEFKLEVVNFYLEKNYGYMRTAEHFSIPSHELVRKWVLKYQEHGSKGAVKKSNIIIQWRI